VQVRRPLRFFALVLAVLLLCAQLKPYACQSSSAPVSPLRNNAAVAPTKPKSHCGNSKITLEKIINVEIKADPAARKYGVDPALLLALFWYESKWDPDVQGCSGEEGLGQFMPTTSKNLGIQDPHDIQETSEKGAKQLRNLLDKYSKLSNDPIDLALAAWNLGEEEVDSCSFTNRFNGITYTGKKPCVPPDEWHTSDSGKKLTNAPTTYVKTVKGYLDVTRKLVDFLATSNDPAKAGETWQLRAELEKAISEIAQRDQEISALDIQVYDLTTQVEILQRQLKSAPSPEAAREAEQRVLEAQREYFLLRSKIDVLSQSDPTTANDAAILRGRLEVANGEIESLQQELIQKDRIIADKTKQIEEQKANIAALQKQVDDLENSPDRSAGQIAILRDKIAAQNSKIKDLEDPLLEKELQTQLGSMSNELDLVCESFAECMSRGQRAYHGNDFSAALGFFRQAEIISPESPLSWHWVGHASMAAGRSEEAFAAWDRILDLRAGIPLTACEEVGQPMCEGGTLTISTGTLSRYKGDNKVFEVPLDSVRVLNAANRRSGSRVTFDLSIGGVAHVFDFFPMGFNCPWRSSVTCPAEGQNVQVKIGEYAARTIQRLTATGEHGSAPASVPATDASFSIAGNASEAKFYTVQWIKPSAAEKVKIWPGSETSNAVLIERLDGAIIQKAAYSDIVAFDMNRKRVRISGPGELVFVPIIPGAGLPKTYQLCFKINGRDKRPPFCFVSESAICSAGEYCREGSDGGATIQALAEDIRGHLAQH